MKNKSTNWKRSALFTVAGVLIGFAYYRLIGCTTGSCPITSNPYISMAYMGFMGWLISGLFSKPNKEEL